MKTIRELDRIACCPSGRCISPSDCYADDRSRSYPVHIHDIGVAMHAVIQAERAEAVEEYKASLLARWRAGEQLRDGDHPV